MNDRCLSKETKLEQKCEVLAALILSIRSTYGGASEPQRAYLETVVGAGIWYIPKPSDAWTGCISRAALTAFHPNSGVTKPRLSEEHVYPRKVAAKMLLNDEHLTPRRLVEQFRLIYGRVHLMTPEENKAVQPFQRVEAFTTPDAAYLAAGVELIQIDDRALRAIKRRDLEVIEQCLRWAPASEQTDARAAD